MAVSKTAKPDSRSIPISPILVRTMSTLVPTALKIVSSEEAKDDYKCTDLTSRTWKGIDHDFHFNIVKLEYGGEQARTELEVALNGKPHEPQNSVLRVVIQNGCISKIITDRLEDTEISEMNRAAEGLEMRIALAVEVKDLIRPSQPANRP